MTAFPRCHDHDSKVRGGSVRVRDVGWTVGEQEEGNSALSHGLDGLGPTEQEKKRMTTWRTLSL